MRVVLIGNQKFGDNGPMDDMAAAGERAAAELGVEFKKIESSPASFEEDIRSMSQEGYDLVITTFGYMSDATKLVAQEFPDTKYAAIFQEINTPEEPVANLWDAVFRGQTTFYVDGYIAGLATKTNRVGFIVGGEEPGPNAEGNGFMRGVRDANPDAVVEFAYASYEDSAKAKEVALAMIDKGCDVIQGDCAAPDAGIIEAVNETGKDVFVMSCIMDYTDASKNFVGTIKMNYGTAVYDAIQAVVDGNFPGGQQGIRDITNDGYYLYWEAYDSFPSAPTMRNTPRLSRTPSPRARRSRRRSRRASSWSSSTPSRPTGTASRLNRHPPAGPAPRSSAAQGRFQKNGAAPPSASNFPGGKLLWQIRLARQPRRPSTERSTTCVSPRGTSPLTSSCPATRPRPNTSPPSGRIRRRSLTTANTAP